MELVNVGDLTVLQQNDQWDDSGADKEDLVK